MKKLELLEGRGGEMREGLFVGFDCMNKTIVSVFQVSS